MIPAPETTPIESLISNSVEWLRLAVEACGAVIVAVGIIQAILQLRAGGARSNFNAARLTLASYLALALEFQLGADILSTAIAPDWDKIGKLGVIAVIRTGLNFFLMREMEAEKRRNGELPKGLALETQEKKE